MGSTGEVSQLSFQLLFGITGMVLLTIFLIVFFVIYQRRLLKEQERTNKIEADYQKSLLNAGILAQEEDRKRIAVDLHDGVGGILSVTKMYINRLQQEMPENEFANLKEKALEAVVENIREIRTVTNDLLPPSLERVGLIAATKDLCNKVAGIKKMKIDFSSTNQVRFDPDREKAVFRILQELLNNTVKHSNATLLKLAFHFTGEGLKVTYSENGQGFAKDLLSNRGHSGGLGLKGIESRVAFLDAEFEYYTSPGSGVDVEMDLKLNA